MKKDRLKLPSMRCDKNCGRCCGIVNVNHDEYHTIKNYAKEKGITPKDNGITCPWYQDGVCKVYPVRPFLCRLFGHVKNMVCPWGYNVNIKYKVAQKMTREYAKTNPNILLHAILDEQKNFLLQNGKPE